MEGIIKRNAEVVGVSPTRWGSVAASLRNGTLKGLVLAVVLAGVFGIALPTQAGEIANFFGIVLASLLQILIGFVGDFFLLIVTVLINVASYNDFVVAVPVEQGWTIVRDVTNMFFILVLLAIAFGTILGVKEWSYADKRLSGLLVMAVVVNFSRTICGLLIDFSQVVMLTFVYGFREAAGANFFTGLKLNSALESPVDNFLQKSADQAIKTSTSVVFGAVVALMLALLMISFACVIVIYLTLMLIVRIVYLWLLIVLSPLAFFMKVVPGSMAKGQYADWWKRFNSQLVFGPLMAFFLWLSLVSVSSGSQLFKGVGDKGGEQKLKDSYSDYTFDGGQSAAFTSKVIQEYLIGLSLMLGGAFMAQGIAGSTAKVAGTAGIAGAKAGWKGAKGAWRGGKWAGGEMGRYAGQLPAGFRDKTTGQIPRISDRIGAWQQGRQEKKQAKLDLADDEKNLRMVSAHRGRGNHAAADALEKELRATGAARMGKTKTPKELRDTMNDDSKNKMERQRAMLALAQQGDDSVKGKGAALTGMVAKVNGSKGFELEMRQALKEKGDQDAMVMSTKQLQDKMAASSAKQNANSLEGIANGVQLGADGKPKQTHAVDKLLNIDKDQYDTKDFSNKLKQQIQDALLVAANLDVNAGNKEALQKKYAELTGGNMSDPAAMARAGDLMAAAGDSSLKARLAAAQAGKPTSSPADTAAAELVGGSDSAARKKADDRVKNMRERLAGGEDVAGMRDEIDEVMQTYESIGLSEEIAKGIDVRGGDGQKMSGDEIVQASQFYKDLQAAKGTDDSKAAADRLAAAASALSDAAGKSGNAAEQQAQAAALQKGSSGLQRADGSFEKALGTGSSKEKLTAAKKAGTEGIASIDVVLKQAGGGISEALKAELGGLRSKMEKILQMKAIGASETETLKDIQKQMTLAKRKLS